MKTDIIKIGLLTIVGLLPWLCNSQNLVPNPSFEIHGTCFSSTGNTLQDLKIWFNPGPWPSSPDYFSSCSPANSPEGSSGVPDGAGFQYPNTGGAYVGIFCSQVSVAPDAREYVTAPLISKLQNGKRYYVSFYCNLSDFSQQAIISVGAYFSDSNQLPFVGFIVNTIPQIENKFSDYLIDTFSWMKIEGSFVANGTEQFITIGNFKDDAHCGLTDLPAGQGLYKCAYYLIDDVTVSLNPADCGIDTTGMFLSVDGVDKETINIYPNPTQDKLYIQSEAHLLSYYTIADIAGNVVQQGDIAGNKISVGDLAKGVYFVRLQGRDGKVYVRKMLKE